MENLQYRCRSGVKPINQLLQMLQKHRHTFIAPIRPMHEGLLYIDDDQSGFHGAPPGWDGAILRREGPRRNRRRCQSAVKNGHRQLI
jgi:hypothetical protein